VNSYSYGSFSFEWVFEEASIKEHTITVEKEKPVLLRGQELPFEELEKLIRKRARWIRERIKTMASIKDDDIVSGSRIKYLGRHFMAVVVLSETQRGAKVTFNARKFRIVIDRDAENRQELIKRALDRFYREAAEEKLLPRIAMWEERTGLNCSGSKLHKFPARWASCSSDGVLEFHPRCIEHPFRVIDYIIVHELVHTLEMSHTKEFWKLVKEKYPQWEECHNRLDWDL